ncbi:MAG: GGDEF domain-containing protein [Oscillospiraceae bacterium]|nr:GGDEF domain-containing protein [Oscillospiraceae bacterium]
MQTDGFRRIVVIAAGINEEYQSSVLSGITDEVKERQINAACFGAFGGVLENRLCDVGENNIYSLPDFRRFDGAVLLTNTVMDSSIRAAVTEAVQQAEIPAVVLDDDSCPSFFNICIDNEKAMREMTEHVISVHHAVTVNYISGPLENPEARSRYMAFLSVMEEHGLPVEKERIFFGDFRAASGREAAETFLRSALPLPDAVICANDAMALEAIGVFKQHGIRVPEDLIVTGFDNTYYAHHHSPSLTSVARPLYEAGRTAVRALAEIWEGGNCGGSVTLDTSLALLESCGCAGPGAVDSRRYRESVSELLKRTRTDVSLFNRMISSLAGAETTEDNVRMLGKFMQELGCEECSICLCDNWQSALRDEAAGETDFNSRGYTEFMSAPYIRTELGTGAIERFRSADLFPVPFTDGGNMSYFLPLHFRARCIGYYIITNGDFPIRSMLCHTFMLGISHSLENIRKLTHLNNAVSELDRLYVIDPLCGIYNRNGFIRLADQIFRHCMQSGDALMLGFIDMDGLKFVNDNFGHDDGDFSLKLLADVISECCGERLICARFGGDEFIVIGSGLTEAETAQFERQFHERLEAVNLVSGKPYRVDASIGTYLTEVTPEMKLFELIAEADQVMYEQKKRKGISRYLRRD